MSVLADIVELGASSVKRGVALWQGVTRISDDDTDVEPLPDGGVFGALGVTSLPYPADDNGKAEGVCLRGVGGRDVTWLGGRDTRSASIVGNCKPGDTVIHSTGPNQAAQLQCKEGSRQVLMATKDQNGKSMIVLLDGKNNKFQIVLAGCIFEINGETKQITFKAGDDAIVLGGGSCALDSAVILGGMNPDPVNKLLCSPLASPAPSIPTPAPAAPLPITAAKGVAVAL